MSLNYEDLQSIMKMKTGELSAQGSCEVGKVEKLVEEFYKMKVPLGSEILDVACGSGILSCYLQAKGYSKIDAIDQDFETINDLKKLHLYRNYIHREVRGMRTTGLESNVYDVVITAGGFAKDAINPQDITELLRILRPQGHLLWTMRAAQEERCAEFGLLAANLLSMEKCGQIKIIRHEQYDTNGKDEGEFYLIKRLPGALPYFAEQRVSNDLKEQIFSILMDHTEPEKRIRFYDEWSDKYEEDLVLVGNYSGHTKCVEAFLKLGLNRSVSILDLACGTGLLGEEIASVGYVNLDGLDSSMQMLNQARIKNIFKMHIFASLSGLGSLPLVDDVYDVVMSSNGFAPGQIYPDSIEEIFRILKPGGYLIFTMRDGLSEASPRFGMFENELLELEKSGKCEVTLGPIKFENFVLDHPGIFYMIRKSADLHLAYTDRQS